MGCEKRNNEMFAVLDVPTFPLQAIRRLETSGPDGPMVVTEAAGRQSQVIAANPAAADHLIQSGMTLAQARSRAGNVRVYSRRPGAEAAAMDLLFAVAYRHTPRIERTGNGILTLDLRGIRRSDWLSFGIELGEEARAHGLELRLGFAPLPDLALFTARTATADRPVRRAGLNPASLAGLPFTATGVSPDLQALLARMGLENLGDLLALSGSEVARRLGKEALDLWKVASGAHTRILRVEEPLKAFRLSQELEYPVEALEPLLFLIRRFLDQLETQLRAVSRYASHLGVILQIDRDKPYSRRFKLPEPTRRSELLFRILHLHLEQVRTAHAIIGVSLEVTPVDPPHRQRGLFHAALKDPWRFTDTQNQLVGIVGPNRVGRPIPLDTHQPDCFHLEPLMEEVGPLAPGQAERARQHPGAALRRYRPPLPARVELRENRPTRLESSFFRGLIERSHGPFLQSGDWWQKDTAWHQTEWDVELVDGTALRLRHSRESWRIEGLYD